MKRQGSTILVKFGSQWSGECQQIPFKGQGKSLSLTPLNTKKEAQCLAGFLGFFQVFVDCIISPWRGYWFQVIPCQERRTPGNSFSPPYHSNLYTTVQMSKQEELLVTKHIYSNHTLGIWQNKYRMMWQNLLTGNLTFIPRFILLLF